MAAADYTLVVRNTFLHAELVNPKNLDTCTPARRCASCPPAAREDDDELALSPKNGWKTEALTGPKWRTSKAWSIADTMGGVGASEEVSLTQRPSVPMKALPVDTRSTLTEVTRLESSTSSAILSSLEEGPVTLVIKNIPSRCTSRSLCEAFAERGYTGFFEFLYVPMKPKINQNRGYAFVGFNEVVEAKAFYHIMNGFSFSNRKSQKAVWLEVANEHYTLHELQATTKTQRFETCWGYVLLVAPSLCATLQM